MSVKEIRSEEIRKIASSLKKGEVSKPFIVNILERKRQHCGKIRQNCSLYSYRLERTQSGRKPLDEVRSQIERTLASQIEAESHSKWLSRLKKMLMSGYLFPNRPSLLTFN